MSQPDMLGSPARLEHPKVNQLAATRSPAPARVRQSRIQRTATMGRRGQPDEAEQADRDVAGDAPPLPPFLEVTCRSSGMVRRFAAGTTARYALHAVNRKLEPGAPLALHVEAVRDGEEPVSFGPSAPLHDYGRGWRLQTVTAHDVPVFRGSPPPHDVKRSGAPAAKDVLDRENPRSIGIYLGKILLAFVFIFLLGGLFTYLLEKLPDMFQPESL